MINLRLYGGLGNQIFQLSTALLTAKKSKDFIVYYDDSSLSQYPAVRENSIEYFFDFSKIGMSFIGKRSLVHSLRLARIFPFSNLLVSDTNFTKSFNLENFTSTYLDGYFQDCLTQDIFEQQIKVLKLCLKSHNLLEDSYNSCVIHIRGGDFVKLGWSEVASASFYEAAITYMVKQHNIKGFDIITDDEDYATKLLVDIDSQLNFTMVSGSMADDFYRLGTYPYRVLSSSTFAFWASALGSFNNPVVIAPEFWSPGRKRNLRLPGEISI
jgi:hypothetical protein